VRWRDGLEVIVEDDDVGLGTVQSTFGSGQGLALHSTMMAVVVGTLAAERVGSERTRVTIALPRSICEGNLVAL
jgi:signal transduction histidine kinase